MTFYDFSTQLVGTKRKNVGFERRHLALFSKRGKWLIFYVNIATFTSEKHYVNNMISSSRS
jgi:hypothetical protein